MNCPTCEYEVDPLEHETCPRCGAVLACSALDCGSCDACPGSLTGFARGLFGDPEDEEA